EVNAKGTLLMTRGFLRLVGSKRAHVLTISSAMGLTATPGNTSYCLNKLAQQQLSRFIAVENPNVIAVSVHPGTVLTDINNDMEWIVRHAKIHQSWLVALRFGLLLKKQTSLMKGISLQIRTLTNWFRGRMKIVKGGKLLTDIVGDMGADQFK
ncbi:hypothetical protein F5884DRAFT_659805, partial [Xylogone sp. PMI_703]